MSIRFASVAAFAAVLVVSPSALAGSPGKWTQLGDQNLANIDEAALARTPDGTLHALWRIPGTNDDTLVHDAIAPNGAAAPPNVVTTSWGTIDSVPDLVATSGGLTAFFGGIRSTDPNESNSNMNIATAPANGSTWSVIPGTIVSGDAAYGSDVGAALLGDGTPLLAFGGTGSGVFVHRGTDPNVQNFPLQSQLGGCCGYSPDVAVDASGTPVVAWISNATGNVGVFAQNLDPATGQPLQTPMKMPGSSTSFNGEDQSSQQLQRIPIVARAGGGIYVAYPGGYPTTESVLVWRVPSSKPIVVASSKFDHRASIAADPDGRLWAFWAESSTGSPIFARRSNRAATKFGPAVKVSHPAGMSSVYKLDGNAQSGALDIVALWGGTSAQQAQFHTQVLPGLALTASPSKLSRTKATKVKFTVEDPDPVKGAKVTIAGESATTDAKGHATITVAAARSAKTAKVAKSGYSAGTLKLKTH